MTNEEETKVCAHCKLEPRDDDGYPIELVRA